MRAEDRLKRRPKGNPPILAQKQSRPTRETKELVGTAGFEPATT